MFPSWDSLPELENWHSNLGKIGFWVPIAIGFVFLICTALWGTYNRRVERRISELQTLHQKAKDENINESLTNVKQDAAELKERIPVLTGALIPGVLVTPPLPVAISRDRDDASLESSIKLFVGNSVVIGTSFPLHVVKYNAEPMLTIHLEDGRLLFSVKCFDKKGLIICEIVENVFHLNPNNHFRIERTPHRLVVYDMHARSILDVEYINSQAIRLLCDFFVRDGVRISISPEEQSFGTKMRMSGTTLVVVEGALANLKPKPLKQNK